MKTLVFDRGNVFSLLKSTSNLSCLSCRTGNYTESLKVMTAAYLEHLSNVRSATLSMSEDCLYLNIFSPNKAQGELT
jgi:hypothetical protein